MSQSSSAKKKKQPQKKKRATKSAGGGKEEAVGCKIDPSTLPVLTKPQVGRFCRFLLPVLAHSGQSAHNYRVSHDRCK